MKKTGSELISEMVGPAGSISEGAFSVASRCEEGECCPPAADWAGLLDEDWARATAAAYPASRQIAAAQNTAEDRKTLDVMKKP
jgi:hypothetical protein